MIKVTKDKWNSISNDFKGVWENLNTPEYIGSKTILSGCISNSRGSLLIENVHFEIVNGFYIVKPLNKEFTRIALVWNNTKETRYGNETISQVVIDTHKHPQFLANTMTRNELEIIANELKECNGIIEEIFVQYEV